jgi:magnesium chelatase family protein
VETVHAKGASLVGTGAELVTVEAQFNAADRGQTEVVITGLPDAVTRESRGRVLCALRENRLGLGPGRLHLNLVPAARPKSGEVLDLPLVLAAAGAGGHLPRAALSGCLFLGEVGIDGSLYPVPGGLAAALAAREAGLSQVIAPTTTAQEAACLPEVLAHGARHLSEVLAHLTDESARLPALRPPEDTGESLEPSGLDRVRGHGAAKRALAVAAAGGHSLLMIGPPGAGKSLLANHLVELLPAPTLEERLEITRVLSAAGRWPGGLATRRPFRAPHHSASQVGLVGGGPTLAPGEVTLAHRGVLFLDELPEFRRDGLEALRTPIERGTVNICRAGRQVELPCAFQLLAAMNPCPCGYRGHPRILCRCPASAVRRYRSRISGPLLDRIDLRLELAPPGLDELTNGARSPNDGTPRAAQLREAVTRAVAARQARDQSCPNVKLDAEQLDRWAPLEGRGRELVARTVERYGLSARAVQGVRRVARTLADLEQLDQPGPTEIAQALGLRGDLAV